MTLMKERKKHPKTYFITISMHNLILRNLIDPTCRISSVSYYILQANFRAGMTFKERSTQAFYLSLDIHA